MRGSARDDGSSLKAAMDSGARREDSAEQSLSLFTIRCGNVLFKPAGSRWRGACRWAELFPTANVEYAGNRYRWVGPARTSRRPLGSGRVNSMERLARMMGSDLGVV